MANNSFSWNGDYLTSIDSPRLILSMTVVPCLTKVNRILLTVWSATVLEETLHVLLDAMELVLKVWIVLESLESCLHSVRDIFFECSLVKERLVLSIISLRLWLS